MGAKPQAGSVNRKSEIWETFRRLIRVCGEEKADLLLIAGDLFHRQPLLRELREVDAAFASIPDTRVVLCAGNHDYMKRDSNYRDFRWSDNVFMFPDEALSCVEFPELDTAVYGLSYEHREIREALYDAGATLNPVFTDSCKIHILLAHGGDDRHIPIHKEALDQMGYDYVALGHIHRPNELMPGKMIYAGALEPIDIDDIGPHGYVRGIISEEEGSKVALPEKDFIPLACREYIHTVIEVDEDTTGYSLRRQITEEIDRLGPQHLYKIRLEGFKSPEVLFDLESLKTIGNILEITDHTMPALDFVGIMRRNEGNLLGQYIASFGDAKPDTVEYDALCVGVQTLLETRKGSRL